MACDQIVRSAEGYAVSLRGGPTASVLAAICVLGAFFLGDPSQLPCGDGRFSDAANVTLLDWNDDDSADVSDAIALLSWQFLGTDGHAGGTDCRAIPGCDTRRTP